MVKKQKFGKIWKFWSKCDFLKKNQKFEKKSNFKKFLKNFKKIFGQKMAKNLNFWGKKYFFLANKKWDSSFRANYLPVKFQL